MKRTATIIAAMTLCLALLLSACGTKTEISTADRLSATTELDEKLNSTVVGSVEGEPISLALFNFFYNENAMQYAYYFGDEWETQEMEEGKPLGDTVRESSIDTIVQTLIAVKKAAENDVVMTQELADTVTTNKNDIISNEQSFNGVEGYKQYLEQYFTTDQAVDTFLEGSTLTNALFEKMSEKELAISDEDLVKDYVKVKHILISFDAQTDEEGNEISPALTDEEAKAKAEEVLAKIEAGEEFDALVEEYNTDPGLEQNGGFYIFTDGTMTAEFEEAAKALENGEVSEPVQTSYGYHIIKRYELTSGDADFKKQAADFRLQKQQAQFSEMLTAWQEEADVQVDEEAIDAWFVEQAELEAAAAAAATTEAETGDTGATAPEGEATLPETEVAATEAE